jgi:hypothetical protein
VYGDLPEGPAPSSKLAQLQLQWRREEEQAKLRTKKNEWANLATNKLARMGHQELKNLIKTSPTKAQRKAATMTTTTTMTAGGGGGEDGQLLRPGKSRLAAVMQQQQQQQQGSGGDYGGGGDDDGAAAGEVERG